MGGSGLPKRQGFAQNPCTSIVLKKIVFVRLICVQYLKPNGFFLMEFFFDIHNYVIFCWQKYMWYSIIILDGLLLILKLYDQI